MKKTFLVISLIFLIIIAVIFVNFRNMQKLEREAKQFNQIYEEYNKEKLNGLDITTVINKAINNNEKYEISKDENGEYISDNMYSIKIYITMIINNKTYPMERINSLGMGSFVEYFSSVDFKCTSIKYHEKTGRISEMTFAATEY